MADPVRAAAHVPWERAVDFATRAFAATGMPPEMAADAGEAIVDADGHGTSTHGLKNLRGYISDLTSGRTNPRPNIRQIGGNKASIVLSADNAQGHVGAYAGMRKAIELAKEYSIGMAIVRDSNHYGHSGFWSSMAVRHNMIGFAITNATAGIAPFGGKESLIGNNPPSWALPTRVVDPSKKLPAAEYQPVFLDMALSTVAANRLNIFHRRGEPLPDGWARDADGNPSTDPLARGAGGTLTGVGGYKGIGMAVVLSMITSFLAADVADYERADETGRRKPSVTGHWFAAYDIAQFTDLERFCEQVRENRERIEVSPPKEGVEHVYAPGSIENAKAKASFSGGIPLEQFTLDDLAWVAEQLGIEYNIV
jgi:L-2-hydroxycarboxylate dehydrogenase (NAD+)